MALRGSLSEIPIQIQIVPMATTDNNDLKNATESGVVPPSKASLPNATAKPSPREHIRAEKIPLNLYFSRPVIFLKYSKKKIIHSYDCLDNLKRKTSLIFSNLININNHS